MRQTGQKTGVQVDAAQGGSDNGQMMIWLVTNEVEVDPYMRDRDGRR